MTARFVFSLQESDYESIDTRLKPFIKGWQVIEQYKGRTVYIPPDWKSSVFPYRYFEVVKTPSDDNYSPDESENEICLCLWAGWKGYDDEVDIRLWIRGKAVLDKSQSKVSAEIFKTSGAPMKLYYNGKLITDFRSFICTKDKIWIDSL